MRRLLPLLILAALVVAPFGRMGAAEAKPMPRHMAMQADSHCADQQAPADEDRNPAGVDCMMVCAAMAEAPSPFVAPPPVAPGAAPAAVAASILAGVRPEADPPPPRLA